MRKIRILHTGDLHLGATFARSQLPREIGRARRQELWETFSSIIKMVKTEDIDILLIAGDLFEYDYCTTADIARIDGKFREIEGVPVFISPGNHDPVVADSLYNTYRWSPNVHIFKGEGIQGIRIENLNTTVWGCGWEGPEMREELLKGFHVRGEDINILLLHCDVVAKGYSSSYLPVLPEQLEGCGADYAALGHIHKRGEVRFNGKIVGRYCGSPEPLDFSEAGQHGIYIAEVGKGVSSVKTVPAAKRRFITERIRVESHNTPEDIIEAMETVIAASGESNLYRFQVVGNTDPAAMLDTEYLARAVGAFYVAIENNTLPDYDLKGIIEEEGNSITGKFLSLALLKIEEETDPDRKKILERAVRVGLEALNGRKVLER
ncbi:MAG: Exonuclease SbcD [Firmicutes bacterium]|nr:Exonuclease SbcD [Bacillota bacterium]MDI6706846.1 DNA repair exonuclease [Bacillota bacterium]